MKSLLLKTFFILTAITMASVGCNLSAGSSEPNPSNGQQETLAAISPVPIITDTFIPFEPTAAPLIAETDIPLPQATATKVPTPTIKNHYYFNNYDSETEGPMTSSSEHVHPRFENGLFVVQIDSGPITYHLILINEDLIDAHVSGQVDFDGGPQDAVGLFCRQKQEQDGTSALYVFLIDRQGNFLVAYRQIDSNGFTTLENTITTGTTDLLNPSGGQLNRLNAVCQGDKLYFFINGALVAEANSLQLQGAGKFGLIIHSADGTENLTAYWDLVALTKP